MGLRKSDAFCGEPYWLFAKKASAFDLVGLGIPEDRVGILVFDETKLQIMETADGYVFREPNNKKEALLGVVRFKERLVEFEERLVALTSVDDKVQLLEEEVFKNLNTSNYLKKTPYIAINLIALLSQESKANATNPSPASAERVRRLGAIEGRMNYEKK